MTLKFYLAMRILKEKKKRKRKRKEENIVV